MKIFLLFKSYFSSLNSYAEETQTIHKDVNTISPFLSPLCFCLVFISVDWKVRKWTLRVCLNIIRQRHHWQNNAPTRSGTATFPHSVPRRTGTNMGGGGKCINVQIAFIKHILPVVELGKIYASPRRASSLSCCVRPNLTLIWQILCPAQMQLFVSFHHLKCVNTDKLLLDDVQHSWALMTWREKKEEGKKNWQDFHHFFILLKINLRHRGWNLLCIQGTNLHFFPLSCSIHWIYLFID